MAEELAQGIVQASQLMQRREGAKSIATIYVECGRTGGIHLIEGCRVEIPAVQGTNGAGYASLTYGAALNMVHQCGYIHREKELEELYNASSQRTKVMVFSKQSTAVQHPNANVHSTHPSLSEAIKSVIRHAADDNNGQGVHSSYIVSQVRGMTFTSAASETDVIEALSNLETENEIYSTVDEHTYMVTE